MTKHSEIRNLSSCILGPTQHQSAVRALMALTAVHQKELCGIAELRGIYCSPIVPYEDI